MHLERSKQVSVVTTALKGIGCAIRLSLGKSWMRFGIPPIEVCESPGESRSKTAFVAAKVKNNYTRVAFRTVTHH